MHCQILDAIYPGKVPLGKVNFDAKTEYEYVANYKVLQTVFDQQQITKHVDVARLIKGKFQDNLEMLQWIKQFFDSHYGGQPYDARARREEARQLYRKGHKHAGAGLKRPEESSSVSPAKPVAAAAVAKLAPAAAARPAAKLAAAKPAARTAASAKKSTGGDDAAELTAQLSKLTVTIEGLEKERNFYFGKLREIEILAQEPDASDAAAVAAAAAEHADVQAFKKQVLAILYATDDNAEFQAPEEAQQAEAAPAGDEGLLGSDELQAE